MLVEWDDAFTPLDAQSWYTRDEIDDAVKTHRGFECLDVGWLVHRDDRMLTLASMIGGADALHGRRASDQRDPDAQYGRLHRLPVGCIRKITVLRKARGR